MASTISKDQYQVLREAIGAPLSVQEARELVREAKAKEIDITAWVQTIDARIRREAASGKWQIIGPFQDTRMTCNAQQKRLIKEHYVKRGFTWHSSHTDVLSWADPAESVRESN